MRAYQISGPNLGYVADSTSSTLRVINGIPGASAMGKQVSGDLKIQRTQVSLERDYALTVNDKGAVWLIADLSKVPSILPIADALNGGDALTLSANGSLAAIYSANSSRIQIIGGLPLNPAIHFEVDTVGLGQNLTAMAINDTKNVVAAFSDGETGALYLWSAGTAPRLISTVGLVSGITFDAGGHRAVIADRAWNQIVLFEDLATTATPIQLAGSADGISNPVGVLLSKDVKTAYIANEGLGTVTVVNIAGGEVRDISCRCRPTTMRLLRGDLRFALTERADEPTMVFDAESTDPHVVIVPAKSPE
jgi:DNA-binding beta-propeller fold protein YncE